MELELGEHSLSWGSSDGELFAGLLPDDNAFFDFQSMTDEGQYDDSNIRNLTGLWAPDSPGSCSEGIDV